MREGLTSFLAAVGLTLGLLGCSRSSPQEATTKANPARPPEPVVNHSPSSAAPGQKIDHGELILGVDDATRQLNAQHHSYKVLETRRVPGPFSPPAMKEVKDFALSKSDLDVINPGPGEYVHVMEGQRHGYQNLTIGITYTAPGGAPPMHSHKGEESHVLLKGQKVLYALGDKLFVKEGPTSSTFRRECPIRSRIWMMTSRSSSSYFRATRGSTTFWTTFRFRPLRARRWRKKPDAPRRARRSIEGSEPR